MMEKKKNRTKKQHYIAQCLINTFIQEKGVYEKIVDKDVIYKTAISNSMCHNNSYEYSLLDENELEKYFASEIDNESVMIIKDILKIIEDENFDINKVYIKVCENLRLFIINYYKSMSSLIRMSVKSNKIDQKTSLSQMIVRIFNDAYINRISLILKYGYKFAIIKSKNENFIMSDQYIATCSTKFKGQFLNISNRDIGIKDTIIFIPFNSSYYGVFYNGDINKLELDSKIINCLNEEREKMVNQVIYDNATFKVLGSNQKILEKLNKRNTISGDITTAAVDSNKQTLVYKVKKEVFLSDEEFDFFDYWKTYKWAQMKDSKRNQLCSCGSGIKYKKCCEDKAKRSWRIINNMHYNQKELVIIEKLGFEEPIMLPKTPDREIDKIMEELKKNNKISIF